MHTFKDYESVRKFGPHGDIRPWKLFLLQQFGLVELQPVPEDQEESRSVRELLERGNRFAREGDYGSACEAFSEALRLLPDYSQARFNLAVALLRKGDAGAAREQLRIFIETDPFNPMVEKARDMLASGEGVAGDAP